MRPLALAVAWCASLAPLLLERAGVLDFALASPESTPRLGLCALAWIALAGLPRARIAASDLRAWWGSSIAAAPVLATAAALDVESGAALARAVQACLWAFAFVALTSLAAELAARRHRSRAIHAALWLAAFLGAPIFAAAFHFGARTTAVAPPAFVRALASASPLQWSLSAADGAASPFAAFAAVVALCAFAAHQEPRSRSMIAVLLLLAAQASTARVASAKIEVTGPCAGISARVEGAGSFELVLAAPLSDGERRTFEVAVPLPAAPLSADWTAKWLAESLAATAHAALLALEPPADLADVDPELRARPRAVLGDHGARLPWSALFVLGAAFAIGLSQRRRVAVASGIAALAGGSVAVLVHGLGAPRVAAARIVEMRCDQASGDPWLAVEARRGTLWTDRLTGERIEVEPAFALVHCTTRETAPRFELSAPGSTLVRARPLDPGSRRLAREVNAFGAFEVAWLRETDGTWRALGPWRLGDALPAGAPGEPPGWLVPALPMGTSVFLGRLAAGELGATFAGADSPTWIRGLGL